MLDESRYDEIISELGHKRAIAAALAEKLRRAKRRRHQGEGGLLRFIADFWHILEPNRPFVTGWALAGMCKHLEAVTRGEITRLLINVPPGSMKSLLVNVFWPCWEWGPCNRPDLRYISFSYASHLTERDNQKFLDLLNSPEFADLYGHQFNLRNAGKVKVNNDKTGWKFASSSEGVGTGERADRVLYDDPHNVKDGESETIRDRTVRFFKEAMSNRLNDLTKSVIIVIMQRVNEADVSGAIIADEMGYVHLCIPMEFESDRRCITYVHGKRFWFDPRTQEDECFWPERFDEEAVLLCKLQGEYAFAGQYQQRPEPRGGGLFKREGWVLYEPENGKFPKFDFVLGSLDSAFTEKEQNDPSGFTLWGCFKDDSGNRAAIPLVAWRKHLALHGKCRPRAKGETLGQYKDDTQHEWGLVQWVAYELERFKANRLLIENKASGHDVHNEMLRLFPAKGFTYELVDPAGLDKWARAIRVTPFFAEGIIYTVVTKYAKLLMDEMAMFPNGRFKDMTDSTTQALWWLRQNGFLVMSEEIKRAMLQKAKDRTVRRPLYPV